MTTVLSLLEFLLFLLYLSLCLPVPKALERLLARRAAVLPAPGPPADLHPDITPRRVLGVCTLAAVGLLVLALLCS
jgi:hypothetical protein